VSKLLTGKCPQIEEAITYRPGPRQKGHVYNTKKTASRGEIGELLLHLCSVLHFGCVPIVCKFVLKTSPNDTVKGFDGVHVLVNASGYEIWLGESKFYTDGKAAISDAVSSVQNHLLPEFLTAEKALLFGHIPQNKVTDAEWLQACELLEFIERHPGADAVFEGCIECGLSVEETIQELSNLPPLR
jgi:hypothetical protein